MYITICKSTVNTSYHNFSLIAGKIDLTKDGLKIIGDDEPSLFCTWEFFEYETQATPVVKASRSVVCLEFYSL